MTRTSSRSSATSTSSATSRLVERLDADFAELVGRLLVFATWRLALFDALRTSADPVLAAIAAKGVKELSLPPRLRGAVGGAPRRRHRPVPPADAGRPGRDLAAGRRAVRPARGGGRAPRHRTRRARPAHRGRCRARHGARHRRAASDPTRVRWPRSRGRAGRDGVHTEAFGYLLAEMQSVARAHPDATW